MYDYASMFNDDEGGAAAEKSLVACDDGPHAPERASSWAEFNERQRGDAKVFADTDPADMLTLIAICAAPLAQLLGTMETLGSELKDAQRLAANIASTKTLFRCNGRAARRHPEF